jgi:hypothetical protein
LVRWDELTHPARTTILEGRSLVTREQGKPDTSRTLAANDALPTRLWIDKLPAFALVGVDRLTLERDFEIRTLRSSDREVQLYLYPQTRSARDKYQRLEVRLSQQAKIAAEIHVVWKDNSHTFFGIIEPKTDVALDVQTLRAR